jgi:hypothetical protein
MPPHRTAQLGKKGYVQLQTTLGNLNLEIHCDFTPRTAENFIGLCKKGYYDGTPFHRQAQRGLGCCPVMIAAAGHLFTWCLSSDSCP